MVAEGVGTSNRVRLSLNGPANPVGRHAKHTPVGCPELLIRDIVTLAADVAPKHGPSKLWEEGVGIVQHVVKLPGSEGGLPGLVTVMNAGCPPVWQLD
jgi:hypothetical protein